MKIKRFAIGRRLLLILSVGIFVIALAVLGYYYLGEVQEKRDLETQLASVNAEIASISLQINLSQQDYDDLEEEISQNKAQIAVVKTQLITSLWSSDIFRDMFEIAGDTDVDLIPISESDISNSSIAGVSYYIRSLTFTAKGSALDIYEFVDNVSQDLDTSILSSFSIGTSGDPAAETSAGMRLTVYSYER
jgi:hypothetical protein